MRNKLVFATLGAFALLLLLTASTGPQVFLRGAFERIVAIASLRHVLIRPSLQEDLERLAKIQKDQADSSLLRDEIAALRDQFQSGNPSSQTLLPARVVAASAFVPGISQPSVLLIDKGKEDGVSVGQAVVLSGNLIGKVNKTSLHLSEVLLVTNEQFSLPARTARSRALGVVRGRGGTVAFEQVLLSDELLSSDLVVTLGEGSVEQLFIPNDIVVGSIVSVDKRPSSLFQSALIKSSLHFAKLSTVFVFMGVE